MSLTIGQARKEIVSQFTAVWALTGFPHFEDNIPGQDKRSIKTPFAEIKVRHRDFSQEALASPIGRRLYSRQGQAIVELYVPMAKGLEQADALTKTIIDAYEGKHTPGEVWFRRVIVNELGIEEACFKYQIITEFEYSEEKT